MTVASGSTLFPVILPFPAELYGAPLGGYRFSGHDRECGREALDAYSEVKAVWVSLK